jgi:hypothetical protein
MKTFGAIRLERNTYVVTYYISGSMYRFPVFTSPSSRKVVSCIYDSSKKDITEQVLPYLGPLLDCNKLGLTPKFFGKKEITIVYDDINDPEELHEKTFREEEKIIV